MSFRPEKYITQDGVIWPRPRSLMQSPQFIRERMAGDIACIRKDCGICTVEKLIATGWTRAQILQHFHPAAKSLGEPSVLAEAAKTGAELAALSMFVLAILLWAMPAMALS